MAQAAAALHQTVTIQHRMDGAFRRDGDAGEPPEQALSDLTGAPAAMLALHVQDVVLHLKGKFVGIPKGTSAPIGQSLHPAFLVARPPGASTCADTAEPPITRSLLRQSSLRSGSASSMNFDRQS